MKLNPRNIPTQQIAKDVVSAIKYDGAIPLSTEMAVIVRTALDEYFLCNSPSDYENAVYNCYLSLGLLPKTHKGLPVTLTYCHKYYKSIDGHGHLPAKTIRFVYDAMRYLLKDKPANSLRANLFHLRRRSNNPRWLSAIDDLIVLAEAEQIS